MENKLFFEYRFKFYLNASHSIIINGRQGDVHPHTWEITLELLVPRSNFKQFNVFEQEINRFFEQYQNKTVNDVPPFDVTMPTLESMVEYFGARLREIIQDMGGELTRIEGSESPTRSYIISYDREAEYLSRIQAYSEEALAGILDRMLDEILK